MAVDKVTTDDMIAQAWPALESTNRAVLLRILILGALRPAWPDAWIDDGGSVCPTSDDDDPDGACYVEARTCRDPGARVRHPSLADGTAWISDPDNPGSIARRVADLLAPFAGQPIPRTSTDDGGDS